MTASHVLQTDWLPIILVQHTNCLVGCIGADIHEAQAVALMRRRLSTDIKACNQQLARSLSSCPSQVQVSQTDYKEDGTVFGSALNHVTDGRWATGACIASIAARGMSGLLPRARVQLPFRGFEESNLFG